MKANLVYEVDGERVILERGSLQFLDQYTFRSFNNDDEIRMCPRYRDLLESLPLGGKFFLAVPFEELSLKAIQYLVVFDRKVFADEQQFDILYGSDENSSKVFSSKKYIYSQIGKRKVFDEFYEKTKDFYTEQEKFLHDIGMIYENTDNATLGVRRVLHQAIDGNDAYDICRIFIDGLSKFNSLKEQDNKK